MRRRTKGLPTLDNSGLPIKIRSRLDRVPQRWRCVFAPSKVSKPDQFAMRNMKAEKRRDPILPGTGQLGFTLTELVVVVGIVALLVAVGLPAHCNTKQKVASIVCM